MSPGCAECWVFPPAATMRGSIVIRHDEYSKTPNYSNASEPFMPRAVLSTVRLVSTPSCAASTVSAALASGWLG